MTTIEIEKLLDGVIHPAFDKSIISLGIVEDITIDDKTNKIKFKLVFKSPDALSSSIKRACEEVVMRAYPNAKVSIIEMVREGAKPKKKSVLELGQEQLENVDKIIAVASGKGGVGKSTVSVNIAIALAKMGYKVGLADADVYGPSIPKMTGTEGEIPAVEYNYEDGYCDNGEAAAEAGVNPKTGAPLVGKHGKTVSELIIPMEKYGVKWMSIGYFAAPEQALIWRGPMACNALKQMILQVKWGELDFLMLDLPPGTGDIHISLVHDIPLSGAIIVTTPQAVALADVEKGINMFRNKDINKHIYGLIENMAWFTPAELPNNKYYIFGKDGGKEMATKYDVPLLGQIPLVQSIRESGDAGVPAAVGDGPLFEAFAKIAKEL
ncbi:MAG: Mrp/NBP35 family ATP-binding protein [Bacteroidales bacterium]